MLKGKTMAAPARLNSEMILAQAMELLHDEGLDRLTVRNLAGKLGVEAPSLYKHFPSKQVLLGRVTVHLFMQQIDQVGACGSWSEWLLKLGRIFWSTQTRIRDSARLVLTTEFDQEQLDLMSKAVSERLARYGIEAETALEMQLSVQSTVLGLSALAEGRSGALIRETISLDAVFDRSLRALVAGWEAHMAGRGNGPAPQPLRRS